MHPTSFTTYRPPRLAMRDNTHHSADAALCWQPRRTWPPIMCTTANPHTTRADASRALQHTFGLTHGPLLHAFPAPTAHPYKPRTLPRLGRTHDRTRTAPQPAPPAIPEVDPEEERLRACEEVLKKEHDTRAARLHELEEQEPTPANAHPRAPGPSNAFRHTPPFRHAPCCPRTCPQPAPCRLTRDDTPSTYPTRVPRPPNTSHMPTTRPAPRPCPMTFPAPPGHAPPFLQAP